MRRQSCERCFRVFESLTNLARVSDHLMLSEIKSGYDELQMQADTYRFLGIQFRGKDHLLHGGKSAGKTL